MPKWLVPLPDRLDAFLANDNRTISRAKAQKAIDAGLVTVNDEVIRKSAHRLQEGDVVELIESETEDVDASVLEPTDLNLTIVYEDNDCVVINKPAGISVHPGVGMAPGEKTILHGAAFLYKKWGLPFSTESVLVHRLDKDTTGCMLIAKNPSAHLFLQRQFEDRTVQKFYLALVCGVPSPAEAVIDAPIGRNVNERTKMAVHSVAAARDARTTYKTLGTANNATLLQCELHTGRTHQIRVHLSTIGHPVLGDGTYSSELSQRLTDEFDIRTLMLHSWKLSFDSPTDGKRKAVQAEPPRIVMEVLDRVGIRLKL